METDEIGNSKVINHRWVILFLATLTQTTTAIVAQGVPTLGLFFQNEFQLSRSLVGMVVVSLNIGALFTLTLAGKAVDRFGERKVVLLGGVLIGLLGMGMVFANYIYFLVLIIFLMGFGFATATPGGSKAIRAWFPQEQRGLAMGIRQMGIPLGGTVAALLLPPIAVSFGWRVAMLTAGVFSVGGASLFFLFYKEQLTKNGNGREQEIKNSLPARHLLSNTSFLATSLLSLVLVVSQFSVVTYMILFLTEKLSYSLALSGSLLAAAQFSGAIGRIVLGLASDKYFNGSRKKTLIIITLINATICLLLAFMTGSLPYWLVAMAIIILGFASIGWNGLFVTLVTELVDETQSATAVGLAMTFTQVGIIIGPPLFGLVIDVTDSYSVAWLLLSGMLWASIILFKFIKEPVIKKIKTKPGTANIYEK